MTLFENISEETFLLLEEVSGDRISNAINGLHPAWIVYDDKQGGKGKNRRLIYPVAYGKTKTGNFVVRAFQREGSSKRGLTTPPNDREMPQWKFFRTDRIKSWRTISSNTYKPDELVGFNPEGDESMTDIYCIAPIGNAKDFVKKDEPKITMKPITKQDVDNSGKETQTQVQQTSEPEQQTTQNRKLSAKEIVNNIWDNIKTGAKSIFDKKNVENDEQNTNINNRVNAPETKPVTKQEVDSLQQQGNQAVNNTTNTDTTKKLSDEPITKQEVDGEEENIESIKNSFNEMLNRMNNLYKD